MKSSVFTHVQCVDHRTLNLFKQCVIPTAGQLLLAENLQDKDDILQDRIYIGKNGYILSLNSKFCKIVKLCLRAWFL